MSTPTPTQFSQRVYRLLKQVPAGRVTTYKALSLALGTKAYQAVGQALKRNPNPPIIPCHRVVRSDGNLGGFNGHVSGRDLCKKKRLLRKEGVKILANKIVNFEKIYFKF